MGENTLNNFFYKLKYGDKGVDKATLVNDCLDIADAEIKANKDAKHTQNTDTDLDATFEATFVKKANTANVLSDITSPGADIEDAVTKKHTQNTDTALATLTAGIPFPATQVPSAGANTLDDYEEGEWTPDVQFGGAKVGITYSTQAGLYTKIGRQVTVTGKITLSAKGSSTGSATINGLPSASKNVAGASSSVSLRLINISFANTFQGSISQNSIMIELKEVTEAGVETVLDNTNFADNSIILLHATYFTD